MYDAHHGDAIRHGMQGLEVAASKSMLRMVYLTVSPTSIKYSAMHVKTMNKELRSFGCCLTPANGMD